MSVEPEMVQERPVVPIVEQGQRANFVRRFVGSPTGMLGLLLVGGVTVVAVAAPRIAPGSSFAFGNPPLSAPSRAHLLGTDNLARDMLKLAVHGIRTSMSVVGAVVLFSGLLGTALGVLAGYAGGFVDDAIMRLSELVQAVPRFFLALLVVNVYGRGLDKIVILLSLTSWPLLARVLRAETLSLRERPFVEAARAYGARAHGIVARHVLPNVVGPAVVVMMLMGSRVILIEAGLAFLGLGDQGTPSLGVMASNAQPFLQQAWWMSVVPGLGIVAVVLGMNLLSDGIIRASAPEATR